jgi:flagellin
MSLNSVNTNMGAMVALQSLNVTQSQLAATQKQISTGYRVADASDDGAAYSIAQGVRSTVGALTSANQQLGGAQGLLSTTSTTLTTISNTMGRMRNILVALANSDVMGTERTDYITQYKDKLASIKNFINDSGYNGKTLIGNLGSATGYGNAVVVRNDSGASYAIGALGGSALYHAISFSGASLNSATLTAALIAPAGAFLSQQSSVGTKLNTIGSAMNYVNTQITFNNDKIDALNSGLGALVDADLAKESAQLTALQIRQQLGTQALSLANQAPQTLLSLFK